MSTEMVDTMTSGLKKDLNTIFTVNHAVEIEMRENGSVDLYRSSVSDIDGQILALAMPMRSTSYVRLESGSIVLVMATHQDALYAVRARVLSNILTPIPLVLVKAEGGLQRMQRRMYVRVETFLPGTSIVVKRGKAEEWRNITATIMSLSCGGILFRSDEKLLPDTDVQVTFQLDDELLDDIRLGARIVRMEEDTRRKPSVYFVGCAFTAVPRFVEKRITNYVFKKQIEMRRRGLV